MKSSKICRIVWITGIYVILAIILYLVVIYKIKWEHLDLNTYLYFYNCNNSLCNSTTKQDKYYSKIICENEVCPYINNIVGEYLILDNKNTQWIYNYISGKIVNNNYMDYRFVGNDLFVVSDDANNQGIINISGEVLVEPKYERIDSYNNGFISYIKGNLYGIDTIDSKYSVEPSYEYITLIDDKIFAGMKNNKYKIFTYDIVNNVNNIEYDYIYSYKDILLVVNDKKIDILTTDLKSTLLMKINTFYKYSTEKERDTLNISYDDLYIYFKVFTTKNEYKEYKYNFVEKKLV